MTDAELDALVANAKPRTSWTLGSVWFKAGAFPGSQATIPAEVFNLIEDRTFNTEAAAMDALRDAVAKYKEARRA